MPSARPQRLLPRLAVAACAGSLLLGAAAGCSTTQEKAKAHQEEAQRILDARAKRQAEKKKAKNKDGKGDEPSRNGGKKQ
ncbi:MAG: hypothetical protein AB7T48_05770 [Solirubrobacterales bacterium]